MIEFKVPQLFDREFVVNALKDCGRQGSENCFGNLFMWYDAYDCTMANVLGMLVCKAGNSYTFPVGDGDSFEVIDIIANDAKERGEKLRFHSLTEDLVKELENKYPGRFTYSKTRDSFDYIYSVKALSSLSGKKYHGKRNHISFFENNFDWSYEQMTAKNAEECLAFSDYWHKTNPDKAESGTALEMAAIHRALENFEALSLMGGILRIQGEIVAYTFGEAICEKLFCTHAEKAVADIRGAYPMINREFAKNTISEFALVNREEDMGIPGLRRAKESYRPEILLEKYSAVQN